MTLSFKDQPFETLLKEIYYQTGYDVSTEYDIRLSEKINIKVKDVTISEVLDRYTTSMGFTYFIDDKSKSVRLVWRERKASEIKGKVINENGEVMAGITVTIKSTGEATATTDQGVFVLKKVSINDILVITGTQIESKEVQLAGAAELLIAITTKVSSMAGVTVSTGYQEIPKERATGSFDKINNELFNRKADPDILSHLDGITSGVLFDKRNPSQTNIQIRGLYTLTEDISQPLVVVNNFPFEGSINNLNLNDVESVTILKDAAASSIWGAKAGNGVIVITTKKGSFNQPPRVFLNSNIIITKKPNLYKIPDLTTSEYIDIEKDLFNKGAFDNDINDPTGTTPLTPITEILLKQRNGEITADQANAQINALRNIDVRKDFEKYVYRNAINKQLSASISGGNKKIKYFFSTGYDRALDDLVGNGNHRITLRSDNTFLPVKNLEIRAAIGYTQTLTRTNSEGDYQDYLIGNKKLPLYSQLADGAGNPLPISSVYRSYFTDTAGGGKLLDWKYRPLAEIANNDIFTKTQAFIGEFNIKYNFFKTLSGEIKYQNQYATDIYRANYNTNSFTARNLINKFTQIDGNTINYLVPKGAIHDYQTNDLYSNSVRGQLNFDKIWGEKHQLHAIGGAELRQTVTTINGHRSYAGNVDYDSSYQLITGTYESIPNYGVNYNRISNRFVSLYSNAAYTYLDRYVFSVSVRKDASNLFGVNTNNKGVPLYSMGTVWKISKERFYNLSFLPLLGLRATYGFSGNVNNSIPAVTTISILSTSASNSFTNLPYAGINNIPNPELRWEKVRQLNLGIDFGTNNNRINGSIEYYLKKSTDVLGAEKTDPTVGFTSLTTNSAGISGSGVDMQLNTVNITNKNFSWKSNVLFGHAIYKVDRFAFPLPQANTYVDNGGNITAIEGYSPYLIASYRFAGLDPATGDPQGYVNGQVSKNYSTIVNSTNLSDLRVSGPALPTWFGNLLNTFSWKGLFLSTNIYFKFGYFFRRPTINYNSLITTLSGHPDYLKRWQHPGDEKTTNIPSFIYPNPDPNRDAFYTKSEITVEKGDHIRLDDIRFNYTINKEDFPKLPFGQIQLYIALSNLNILLWKANSVGLDPDYPTGLIPGRMVTLGAKINF